MTELTDDLGLSEEFLTDECVARDEDNYGREPRCTCGYLAARNCAADYSYERPDPNDFARCRGCNPVDHEAKPYGWGLERWEDPALEEANRAVNQRMGWVYGAYSLACHQVYGGVWHAYRPQRDELWAALSKHDRALERRSRLVWDALCDCCETHTEAVGRYTRWAERATGRKRRAGM